MSPEERARQWVYVHVETVERENGIVLFDFVDSNEYSLFASFTDGNESFEDGSMVRMYNYHGPAIIEGVTYVLLKEKVQEWFGDGRLTPYQEGSLIIRFALNAEGMKERPFQQSFSFTQEERRWRNIDFHGAGSLDMVKGVFQQPLKLVVRDVGQGSWNEVYEGDSVRIVYDAGTSWTAGSKQVIALIGNRDVHYQNDKPGFVLSHWDVDHYHLLLGMSANTIASFQYFICRGTLPNLTSRRVFSRVLGSVPVVGLAPRPRRLGIPVSVHPVHHDGSVVLYNAEHHRDRNRSGILMTISGGQSTAILPGDHHYYQIAQGMGQFLYPDHMHHLVVPHHGGNAGQVGHLKGVLNCGQAAVSVGHTHYKHPTRGNINQLTGMGFNVQQTTHTKADIQIPLP